jgi:amino acid permease
MGSTTDSKRQLVQRSPFILPMESPTDLKWQIHMVTCRMFRQNHRRFHRRSVRQWNRQEKLIYVQSTDPLLPYFSFFLIPTLPICKQPVPLPPKQKSLSYQHNKLYFLKFCGHNIRVLIYRRILSIFVNNSIFLNFNI